MVYIYGMKYERKKQRGKVNFIESKMCVSDGLCAFSAPFIYYIIM